MTADRPQTLLDLARGIASANPSFQEVRGAGVGDRATASFMRELQADATETFGTDHSEKRLCGDNAFAVDFFFPEEETIVEVALGLPNPACEFEKDILKAIMARELGHCVRRLFFISRAGAIKKCNQPGRTAIRSWVLSKHGLTVEVHELGGEPRRRNPRSSSPHATLPSGV
jgi:hypothetical protein